MKLLIKKLLIEGLEKHVIDTELNQLIGKYEVLGMACWVYLKGDAIQVSSIKVKDKTKRKEGLGTAFMTELTQLCDKHKLLCVLSPDSSETPMSALLRFYKNFGFVKNSGRHKDFRFRESMIRFPKK